MLMARLHDGDDDDDFKCNTFKAVDIFYVKFSNVLYLLL